MRLINRILYLLKPIQIWFQRRGRRETIITDLHVNSILSLVQPGDILLSYEDQRWTSCFIRGNFDHAALVTDDKQIMEAVGDYFYNCINIGGVRKVPLTGWLYKKDHVALIRPTLNDICTNYKASLNAQLYLGKSYDYSFWRDGEAVYCSELPYLCYSSEDPTFMDIIPVDKEILPIDYLKMTEEQPYRFKVLYNTRG